MSRDDLRVKNLPKKESSEEMTVKVLNENASELKPTKKNVANIAFKDMWANAFFKRKVGLHIPLEVEEKQKAPTPYVYLRVFFMYVVIFLLLISVFYFLNSYILFPILVGLLITIIPATAVVFFYEMDTSKRVSLYTVLFLLFISIATAVIIDVVSVAFIFNSSGGISYFGSLAIGVMEGVAIFSLSAIIITLQKIKDMLSGVLIGAIIGAGFAFTNSLLICFFNSFVETQYMSNLSIIVLDESLIDSLHSVIKTSLNECLLRPASFIMMGCVFAGMFSNVMGHGYKSKTLNIITILLLLTGILFASLWLFSFSSQTFVIILRVVMTIAAVVATGQIVRIGLSKNDYE